MITLKDNVLYRIKKVSECANALFREGGNNYVPGRINPGVSLPIDYEVEGYILSVSPELIVARIKRNGVACLGTMSTSTVSNVTQEDGFVVFETMNSIYHVEEIV